MSHGSGIFSLDSLGCLPSLLIQSNPQPHPWATADIMALWSALHVYFMHTASRFLAGNMPELFLSEKYGEHEFQWLETYGPFYSIQGCFGESRLMISDPLALKYIINNHHTQRHRHLRNIMNPLFSSKNIRASLPIIKETARKLVEQWGSLGFPGHTVDISGTISDVAQDVTGDAILRYSFDSLTGESDLSKAQRTIIDSAACLTKSAQLVDAALPYIPDFFFRWAWHLPLPGMRIMQVYRRQTYELSRHLVQKIRDGEGSPVQETLIGRLCGFFARGNHSIANPKVGVPDEDIPVHLRTILLAAQDTLARLFVTFALLSTLIFLQSCVLQWTLYKLAQMEDLQQELRLEIQSASANGIDDLDYDKMPLLSAIINVGVQVFVCCILPLTFCRKFYVSIHHSHWRNALLPRIIPFLSAAQFRVPLASTFPKYLSKGGNVFISASRPTTGTYLVTPNINFNKSQQTHLYLGT
ncbi:Cytochrome P450 [Mycena venus]|uniref:Cytochrome P450 n=1 Tax=Mycena venus TaxID=2733690 RepID=A0A8H6YFW1_9AGAR|nr:Cytochrome P450 [Mycena venus]